MRRQPTRDELDAADVRRALWLLLAAAALAALV